MKLHRKCVIALIEMVCGGEKKMECVLRGYDIYKDIYIKIPCIWAAVIREELVCTRQATNAADSDQQVHYTGNEETNHKRTLTKKDV